MLILPSIFYVYLLNFMNFCPCFLFSIVLLKRVISGTCLWTRYRARSLSDFPIQVYMRHERRWGWPTHCESQGTQRGLQGGNAKGKSEGPYDPLQGTVRIYFILNFSSWNYKDYKSLLLYIYCRENF